jgi:serine/threonine protein phosphatase PrpC
MYICREQALSRMVVPVVTTRGQGGAIGPLVRRNTLCGRISSYSDQLEALDPAMDGPHGHSCKHCRYPCQATTVLEEKCRIATYLEEWHNDSELKPPDFDKVYFSKHQDGVEAAVVSFGGRQVGGWKSENQDNFFLVALPGAREGDPTRLAVGLFDGHGENGAVASRIASGAFSSKIEAFAQLQGTGLLAHQEVNERFMQLLFEHTEDVFDSYPCDFLKSGTTAVVCFVSPESVTGGWIGDSRAIVGLSSVCPVERSMTRVMIPLTEDHKPDPLRCPSEADRVTSAGGRIDRLAMDNQGRPTGPYRVFLKDRWVPGLAVSRSFGDHVAREAGVIASPDVHTLPLISDGVKGSKQVIILGTDGLWEWVSSQDAMSVAWSMDSAQDAAHALAEMAQKNWALYCQGRACDDITVAVIFTPNTSK